MDSLIPFFLGRLSASDRVWTALAPALVLIALIVFGLLAYALRSLFFGRFQDEEAETRGLGGLTTARARHFFAWLMRPLWRGLAAAGVPPNAITSLSVAFALGSGLAASQGRFALAGWIFFAAASLDFLDGRVARATGRTSRGGAALDSVLDRYCEAALLTGLAWYYRDSWVLVLVLLALSGSLLVPYVRARGEALGAKLSDVGFMQRPERLLVLGAGIAFAPIPEALLAPENPHPPHRLAVLALLVLAITAHATALQRLTHLLRSLGNQRGIRWHLVPRALVVSIVATASDFVVVQLLLTAPLSLPLATFAGCAVGGVVAFLLSRGWAFGAAHQRLGRQLSRFAFVSGSSALLNAGGVAIMLLVPAMEPLVAWGVTRAVVFVCWNFPLLSDWAFPESPSVRGLRRSVTELDSDLGAKSAPDTV
jgi:phosphatidylglycerophosphate synthase/putative flippase GtrA